MTLCRLIAAQWAMDKNPNMQRVLEGYFNDDQLAEYNVQGYNLYYLPNAPLHYDASTPVTGAHIDQFNWVFCDMDLKDKVYSSKDAFLSKLTEIGITPTQIVDSGGGIHAYWKVSQLDTMSYLRFQRRLMRLFSTDEAVGQLFQLMRLPGSLNVKLEDNFRPCEYLADQGPEYSAEELDKLLPPITMADEAYCEQHYNKTYGINQTQTIISDILPSAFGRLIGTSSEAKSLWAGASMDRSKSDYRLAHLMYANDFTRADALSVLVNSAKALQRAPIHRTSYAQNIVDKIWTYEQAPKATKMLSSSVKDILQRSGDTIKGTPFRCNPLLDNTVHGFRLSQVLGIVGGSGCGKTAVTLNGFRWFVQNNPDYVHFFVPLEQPSAEIADRWKTMCGEDTTLHDKVEILSNYDEDGNFRHLSLDEIKDYIIHFQTTTGKKVGCVVVDHIGALKKKGKEGENQDIMDICHAMKAFAVQTNTFLIMQSQSSREKAGIGDLELNKDAAYGTVYFESYCDYLMTIWQPLKRCHSEQACPTVTAFKYCKIRHKKTRRDVIQEDVPYFLYFDSDTEQMRALTQDEITSFNYFLPKATNKRKLDRKTDLVVYQSSIPKPEEAVNVKSTGTESNRHSTRH